MQTHRRNPTFWFAVIGILSLVGTITPTFIYSVFRASNTLELTTECTPTGWHSHLRSVVRPNRFWAEQLVFVEQAVTAPDAYVQGIAWADSLSQDLARQFKQPTRPETSAPPDQAASTPPQRYAPEPDVLAALQERSAAFSPCRTLLQARPHQETSAIGVGVALLFVLLLWGGICLAFWSALSPIVRYVATPPESRRPILDALRDADTNQLTRFVLAWVGVSLVLLILFLR